MNIPVVSVLIKGLVVGASMLVPGVSGGTTAIILGIYDKLIHAVSSFFRDIGKNLVFLALFCVGAGVGILLFSRVMLWAVETWELPMMFFFLGAIIGSIPMLYRQAKADRFSVWYVVFALVGVAIVLSLGYLPKPDVGFSGAGMHRVVMLVISGMIIAVALVLPGISTSHMLLVLGMYQTTLDAIKTLNFAWLVPLAIGGLAGIILTTSLIEKALTKYPRISYFFIIGFVLGSIIDVFPGFPSGIGIPVCVATFAAGYAAIRIVSRFSKE
jgi:putative membrane protein